MSDFATVQLVWWAQIELCFVGYRVYWAAFGPEREQTVLGHDLVGTVGHQTGAKIYPADREDLGRVWADRELRRLAAVGCNSPSNSRAPLD